MENLEISDLPQVKKWKRQNILNWLSWNDKNGIYQDKEAKQEGYKPMTKKEALDVITRIVTENN